MTRRSPIAFLVGLTGALAFGWLGLPHLRFVAADQPLQFSHRVHTSEATGLACADCHSFRANGEFAGIPPLATCSGCHADPIGTSPDEKRLVEEFVKTGREIPWHVYSRQPDNVRFPHAPHVTEARIPCESCHGAHGTSESLFRFETNRVSGYARGLATMGACEGCHRERGRGATACIGCHR
ncbi:MAG TPA: menaquinone reductase multiheme cytochrome c subunit QrcA [Vicinamibacteria bacterium]